MVKSIQLISLKIMELVTELNTDTIISCLKGTPLFSNLGPVFLTRVVESSEPLKFDKGSTIQEEGKNCNSLFIVASGKLEVYRKIIENTEVVLQTLERGGIFGEAHVLDASTAAAGLRAAENSVVISIARPALKTLMKDSPNFCQNYIRYMISRAREDRAREDRLLKIILSSGLEIPEPYSLKVPGREEEAPQPPPAGEINKLYAPEDQEEDGNGEDVFFRKELICPLCAARFRTLKPRRKYVIVEKADDDFCLYYKLVNPLFYEINVCPKCGYSFNMSTGGPVKAELKKGLAKALDGIWKSVNYCGSRTLEDAVETFKLALECQRLAGADNASLGRLYLKLGWLYRYLNMKDQERQNLNKALYHLSRYFETGSLQEPKEEMNLMFLLGQLHLILGDERGAVNWFIQITQHPAKKTYPYIVNRARDTWQEIRQKSGAKN